MLGRLCYARNVADYRCDANSFSLEYILSQSETANLNGHDGENGFGIQF